jgi:hypothetical protein
MSVRVDASKEHISLFELEEQMLELLRLRRALCLLNAKRKWLQGSRRNRRSISRAAIGTQNIIFNGTAVPSGNQIS